MQIIKKTVQSAFLGTFFGFSIPLFFYYVYVFVRNFIIPHVNDGKGGYTDPITGEFIWDGTQTIWWCENFWYHYGGWDCTFTEWMANKWDLTIHFIVLPAGAVFSVILFLFLFLRKSKKSQRK